jgi:hypothetical protein
MEQALSHHSALNGDGYIGNRMSTLSKIGFIANVLCLFALLTVITTANAGSLLAEFPTQINANEKYVFYSHGFIVEGTNPTPINPRWGKYDFPEVKKALSDEQYNLIAYHRAKGTDPRVFAKKLAADINKLTENGVPYRNIYLVGFSRGGAITVLTSNEVASDNMNIIILAGCSRFIKNNIELQAYGNVYSIYETSDGVGSCQFLIDRSEHVKEFEEMSISTGKEHGAFYNPLPEWVVPVKAWIKASKNSLSNNH